MFGLLFVFWEQKNLIEISCLSIPTKNWRALGGNLGGHALYLRFKGNFGVEWGYFWGQIGIFWGYFRGNLEGGIN